MWPLSVVSARVLAPALLVGPAVAVSAVLIVGATRQSAAIAEDLGSTATAGTQRRVAERLEGLLDAPRRLVDLNTRLLQRGAIDARDPETMRAVFFDQMRAFDRLSAVSWGGAVSGSAWVARYTGAEGLRWAVEDRASGEMVLYGLSADGRPSAGPLERYDFALAGRPWYELPVAAGRAVWTPPYVWRGGDGGPRTIGIGYNAPAYDASGDLLGVLNADMSLLGVSAFLGRVERPEGAALFVVDRDGTLVATSTGPVSDGDATLRAADSPDPLVRAAASIADAVVGPTIVRRRLEVEGEPYRVDASGFSSAGGLEWVIVTATPEAALFGAVDRARSANARKAGIAVLITVLVGMGLGSLAVRPLLSMRRHADRIGDGDFDSRVRFGVTPELRGLGASLNAMAEHLKERYEIRRALELASEVQRALLPERPPRPEGLELVGLSRYCDETGGDYYDFLDVVGVSDDSTVIVVGDVMGHGIAAAMLMATARGILRSHAEQGGSLANLLTHVNRLLSADTGGMRFMTMQLVEIEPGRDGRPGTVRWASAGHGPPMIYNPAADTFIETDGGGLPLGIDADETYREVKLEALPAGAVLVSATDGVWEAKSPDGEQFGMERVHAVVRAHHRGGADAVSKAINAAVHEHMGEEPADDDVTLVVARLTPASTPAEGGA